MRIATIEYSSIIYLLVGTKVYPRTGSPSHPVTVPRLDRIALQLRLTNLPSNQAQGKAIPDEQAHKQQTTCNKL